MKYLLLVTVVALGATIANADIVEPAKVKCTATKVTPVGANFFSGGPARVVLGDTTELELNGPDIGNLVFASGAQIGPTVIKHNLVKQAHAHPGFALYEVAFKSQHNQNDYQARLVAHESTPGAIMVSLDILEIKRMGRLKLHSLELDCARP